MKEIAKLDVNPTSCKRRAHNEDVQEENVHLLASHVYNWRRKICNRKLGMNMEARKARHLNYGYDVGMVILSTFYLHSFRLHT